MRQKYNWLIAKISDLLLRSLKEREATRRRLQRGGSAATTMPEEKALSLGSKNSSSRPGTTSSAFWIKSRGIDGRMELISTSIG